MNYFFNRNLKLVRTESPKLLTQLGFKILGEDAHYYDFYGGTVSYLVVSKKIKYFAIMSSLFGKVRLQTIFPMTEVEKALTLRT